eukprot:SAG22_NODE_6609_length_832_cov_0.778990_1_plen_122_part_00
MYQPNRCGTPAVFCNDPIQVCTCLNRIFDEGAVPDKLVVVLFVMLYKGAKKGTVDAFDAYRPIGLLSHAWKLAEAVFMEEQAADTELFLEPATKRMKRSPPCLGGGGLSWSDDTARMLPPR